MSKYKYYFRKPKGEITKDILTSLFVAGVLVAGGGFAAAALWNSSAKRKKYPKKKFCDTFTRLRRKGLLEIHRKGHDLKIRLTPEGRRIAGYMQVDKLKVKRPKKWDGFWRVILFDISVLKTPQRNGFRGMLRDIGAVCLQKSAWLHAFDCTDEIELLKDFFGLKENEVRVILAKSIGNDAVFRKHFRI